MLSMPESILSCSSWQQINQQSISQYLMLSKATLCALVVLASSMFTFPHEWKQKGIDITDGILEQFPDYNLQIDTKCSEVNLNKAPYNYNGTVMSGYLKVGKGQSAIAFIFYGKEKVEMGKIKDIPTVLWLNGGPGSSSQLGNFLELGPFWLKTSDSKAFDITRNNNSWVRDYNVIFVDQPIGTGLSYADPSYPKAYVTNMSDLANDFYQALKELYQNPMGCFQKLGIKGEHPLFVFGQSYGGKYAPAISEKILREAKDNKGFLTGLKGVAIGDGFTYPFSTLAMMGEYAYNFGLLDYQQRAKIERTLLNATYQELSRSWRDLHVSFYKVLDSIVNGTGGVNVYDITKYQSYPTELLDSYFASDEILSLYGLDPSIKFNKQKSNVQESLYEDFMKNEVALVEKILINYDAKVMVYTGQNDLICNTPGTLRWVENLHFANSTTFRNTLMAPWKINGQVRGFYKRFGNLELRSVNDAGHLLPMDQGEVALNMLNDFINNALAEPRVQGETGTQPQAKFEQQVQFGAKPEHTKDVEVQ